MKEYWKSLKVVSELTSITCDVCGTKHESWDELTTQEYLSYTHTGGYAAPFGDMVRWSIDICPDCLPKVLGDYVQLVELV